MAHCIHDANIDAEERQAVKDLWKHTQSVVSKGRYGLVVLDELSLAMNYDLIATQHVVNFFAAAPTPGRCDSDRAGYAGGAAKYGRPGNGISAKLFAVEKYPQAIHQHSCQGGLKKRENYAMHSPQAGLCAGCVPASGFPGNGENTLLGPERASGSRFNPPRPPGTPPGRGI